MAKCTNCNGTGIVGEGRLGRICGRCKGIGFVDEPRPKKKEPTNEEWFTNLSTEEKAKWLSRHSQFMYECGEKQTIPKTMYEEDWEWWLKED